LLDAWKEFSKGKRSKEDVALFEMNLENNLFDLHRFLASGNWRPDPYVVFFVHDPKLRKIHKATVRDRVLYQAVYRSLYQIFDSGFIYHSFSSRDTKGTHAGVSSFEKYIRQVSANYTNSGYALKCDIRKFFDSIDHNVLFDLVKKKITDEDVLSLIRKIIDSFSTFPGKGLPLGNVTSQLFANVYMNELDQYAKRELKAKCYVRYCDDFGIIAESKEYLEDCVEKMKLFCKNRLLLDIHPRKISIRKINQGVDFLGYVILPHRRVLRTNTRTRVIRKLTNMKTAVDAGTLEKEYLEQSLQSYLGVLSHCKGENVMMQIERVFYD
jgi:retron-type reverse transcriptase